MVKVTLTVFFCLPLLAALLLLLLRIRVKIDGNSGEYLLTVRLLFFKLYTTKMLIRFKYGILPVINERHGDRDKLVFPTKEKNEFLSRLLKAAVSVMKVTDADISISIGTEDAAVSSVLAGLADIAASIGLSMNKEKFESGCLKILPDFEKTGINLSLSCIIYVGIADIIAEMIIMKGGSNNASNRKYIEGNNV